MSVIQQDHPAAETDHSVLDLIAGVVMAMDPADFELKRWDLMLAEYRKTGPRFIAAQRTVGRIFEAMCELDGELQEITGIENTEANSHLWTDHGDQTAPERLAHNQHSDRRDGQAEDDRKANE